jgi:hypothetical protein
MKAGHYQDIFRALGYELEQVAARQIVVDEVDGSYVLMYHSHRDDCTTIRKHRTTMSRVEGEEMLRQARARRRAEQRGWLRRPSDLSSDRVQVMHLTQADPCLERSSTVLYEYTLPSLRDSTVETLQAGGTLTGETYRVHRSSNASAASLEDRLLKPFEAARLLSTLYARCLDPVRFSGVGQEAVGKSEVVVAFTRSLSTDKGLAAVELVAQNIDGLRSLDAYEAGLGTNAVRWMQYLAAEALDGLEASTADPAGALPEQGPLHRALRTIARSVTAADRFAAMRRITGIR